MRRMARYEGSTGVLAMKTLLSRFMHDEAASAAVEYSVVASIVSLAVVTAAITIGTSLNSILQNVSGKF